MVSLFGSLNVGEQALRASSVALQTVGQNIANASNETFHRQRVFMDALPALDKVTYQLGSGVDVERVERVVDMALENLIREAKSELGSLEVMRDTLTRLETVLNEFTDSDLSTSMADFWEAVDDFSNNVESSSARRSVILAAESLSQSFAYFSGRILEARSEANDYVKQAVGDINRIAREIADLNKQVSLAEDGGLQPQEANDLRDRRDALVEELSKLIRVKTTESSTGMLQVYTGSEFLVFDTNVYDLTTVDSTDDGVVVSKVVFEKNGMELKPQGGELKGYIDARDTLLGGYSDSLDELAGTMIYEVNRIHSSGRGIEGYAEIAGTYSVSDVTAALNAAGLPFDVENGSFTVNVRNVNTGHEEGTPVKVDMTGTGSNTTLAALVASLDGIDGISANITGDNRIHIQTDDSGTEVTFSNDTSGVLAALGVASFFTGSGASDMAVSSVVENNLNLLAGAKSPSAGDNSNALEWLSLRDSKVLSNDTETMDDYYTGLVGTIATESASYQDRVDNQTVLTDQMVNERQAISGVNLDEEALNLVQYQQAFQAAARFLSVISEMMDVMMSI